MTSRLILVAVVVLAGCATPGPVEIGDAITRPPTAVDPPTQENPNG